jgi:hypothetical protein
VNLCQLQAGSELDALVTEKLMGGVPAPYSTDLESARLVAGELWRHFPLGSHTETRFTTDGTDEQRCTIAVTMDWAHGPSLAFAVEYAETTPLAICRAALRAAENR